jgi:hypothetical protein
LSGPAALCGFKLWSSLATPFSVIYVRNNLTDIYHTLTTTENSVNDMWNIFQIKLKVLALYFMTKICKKVAQDFHRAFSKVFDRVKSVALWSANIRKMAHDF